jgi:hypothetical protein
VIETEAAIETGRPRLGQARAALLTFIVFELAMVPLLLHWGRKWWFWADDWDFLAARTGGNLGDLFRPHYQHWTTLPILAYRLLWVLFGIRHYVPYQLLLITLHLTAALLLRAVMVRAGTRPWMATLVAGVFVVFGAGAENIVVAFQITFVGALVFGLAQLLLADHDGPIDRRDAWALLAGLAGLMCSGVAIGMVLVVGLAMQLRRGWRVAALQTAPLAVVYIVWYALSPVGPGAGGYRSQSPGQVVQFVGIGIGSGFGRLAQLPFVGILLAAVLVAGIGVAVHQVGPGVVRGRFAVPLALLAGAFLFLVVTGLVRSGVPATNIINGKGPERARQSRYVYIVAALALPALAIAADAIARRWRALTIPVVVLLLVGVPGNIRDLRTYANHSQYDRAAFRAEVLEAPRLPLARRLPRFIEPALPYAFYGLTLGWLLDSEPSGRIPAPPRLTASDISTQTLYLGLQRGFVPTHAACRRVPRTERVVLKVFEKFTLVSGRVRIEYVPPTGARSLPMVVQPGWTMVTFTGPLPVEIQPLLQPVRLCGPARPNGPNSG